MSEQHGGWTNQGPGSDPPHSGIGPGQPQQYPAPPQQAYQQAPYAAMPPQGYGYPGTVIVQQSPSNGIGTAGFVTGLLGLIFCWVFVFGLVLGLLGVILGGVGISSGHKKGAGTGLAIAGLVLGLISLVPSIIIFAAVASLNGG
jgi:hypothetical protein